FRVAINSRGARGEAEVPYEKGEALRIVVLGDSFAFGEDVDDDQTFPFHLGALMGEGTEVVNLGVHGYGTDQMALMLLEEGCRYSPDIVVVTVFYHDILRCRSDYYVHAKPFYRLVDGALELMNVPVPGRPEPLGLLDGNCFTWAFIGERLSRKSQMKSIENLGTFDRAELWRIQTGLFRMMKDLCGERTRVVVVSIADPGDLEAEWFLKFDRDFGRLIREEAGIGGFISTLEPLKEAYRDHGAAIHTANSHLSPLGNRIVAGLIRDHIEGPSF
ncbi:SGNH/GDSL hydrolase family protein, partial [Thermodesulfobacteriota bacterium]